MLDNLRLKVNLFRELLNINKEAHNDVITTHVKFYVDLGENYLNFVYKLFKRNPNLLIRDRTILS